MAVAVTEVEAGYIVYITLAVSITSVLSCCAAIAGYAFCRYFFPKYINRVSLRLSVATSIADLLYSLIQIWSNYSSPAEPSCSLSAAAYIGLSVLPLFLYFSMATNLILVFVFNYREVLERWYYICSIALAIAIMAAGASSGQLGWDEPLKTCWFKHEGKSKSFYWQIGLLYSWVIFVSISCLSTVIIVIRRLWTEKRLVERLQTNTTLSVEQLGYRQVELKRLVHRIVLYPLIPVITQTSSVLLTVYFYVTGDVMFWIVFMAFVTNAVQGLLNSIALYLDPAIIKCVEQTKIALREGKVFDNQLLRKTLSLLCCISLAPCDDEEDPSTDMSETQVQKSRTSSLPMIEIVGAIPMQALSSPPQRSMTVSEYSISFSNGDLSLGQRCVDEDDNVSDGETKWQSMDTKSSQSLWKFL